MRREIPAPKKCQTCGRKKLLDLANVTGEYKPEEKHWKYLCRSCHMRLDGTVKNLRKKS